MGQYPPTQEVRGRDELETLQFVRVQYENNDGEEQAERMQVVGFTANTVELIPIFGDVPESVHVRTDQGQGFCEVLDGTKPIGEVTKVTTRKNESGI